MEPRAHLFFTACVALAACRTPTTVQSERTTGETSTAEPPPAAESNGPTEPANAHEGFAVVELFTSEGCSSCPAADDVLAELAVRAERQNQRVYPLAFHVDYWNALGWSDRFSSAAFTERQQDYANAFRSRRMYTPQLIVNGTDELVGSDRGRAGTAIERALTSPSKTTVNLEIATADARTVRVKYVVQDAPKDAVLRIALVDREDTSDVRSGENAGRTLRHARVVRAFETIVDPSQPGTRTLRRPPESGAYEIVGYVQRASASQSGGLPILAAARAR